MSAIYEPCGAAREYAELALNHYLFCSHGCTYCYSRLMMKKGRRQWANQYREKKNVLADLEKDCRELTGDPRNVLLCFMSDPYQPCESSELLTRRVLEAMQRHTVKPTILTKGGQLAQRDFDILSSIPGSEFAATLTSDNVEESLSWEPGAALPQERIDNLRAAHEQDIRTWVSFEPVFNPDAVYKLIRQTHHFVDLFKIGKLNHDKRAHETDWPKFRTKVIDLLESLGCEYMVKDALRHAT